MPKLKYAWMLPWLPVIAKMYLHMIWQNVRSFFARSKEDR